MWSSHIGLSKGPPSTFRGNGGAGDGWMLPNIGPKMLMIVHDDDDDDHNDDDDDGDDEGQEEEKDDDNRQQR